jgi:signal peptidase II
MMLRRGLAVAAAATALDQLSKFALLHHFHAQRCALYEQTVTPFFKLVLACNHGVSFGLFNTSRASSLLFALAAVAIVLVLIGWLSRARSTIMAVAIGLVIGGALGNVVDRLRFGGVIDFLYFHAGSWYWPAFNLADTAIFLGVATMLLNGLTLRHAPPANRGEDVAP